MKARPDPSSGGTHVVPVWDPVVRVFHWTVAAGCAVNLLLENGGAIHRTIGYGVAVAVAVRIAWGFLGKGHARFSDFIPTPAALVSYLRQLASRSEPRFIGHNPAAAVMILALLGSVIAVSITGWMMGLDRYFGNETLEELHEGCATAILVLAGIHVLGAIIESVRHRENLIVSMFTGKKRSPSGSDVDHAIDSH